MKHSISLETAKEIADGVGITFAKGILDLYVEEVNSRAEQDILKGNPITGAHHRAMKIVKEEYDSILEKMEEEWKGSTRRVSGDNKNI